MKAFGTRVPKIPTMTRESERTTRFDCWITAAHGSILGNSGMWRLGELGSWVSAVRRLVQCMFTSGISTQLNWRGSWLRKEERERERERGQWEKRRRGEGIWARHMASSGRPFLKRKKEEKGKEKKKMGG